MPIIAETKQYPKAPEGVHRAVCYGIYDIGTQESPMYGPKRNVVFLWELSDELMDDGRPFAISETYTLSMNEKANLRKKLVAWRGKMTDAEASRFDITQMLGKPCQLSIAHKPGANGKIYANVTAITGLGKGMSLPNAPVNELRAYSITDDEIPPNTPNWIIEKIHGSEEKMVNAAIHGRPAVPQPQRSSAPAGPRGMGVPAGGRATVPADEPDMDGGDDEDLGIPF